MEVDAHWSSRGSRIISQEQEHAPELEAVMRPAAADPDGAIVLVHGRGADEQDLLPLLDVLDPRRRLVGLAPRGPLSLPPGGAHWYVVERVGFPHHDSFHSSYRALGAWLDSVPERVGVPQERVVLGGFSQGAVMSLACGLGVGRPRPAGIVALSGFVPTVDGFEIDEENAQGLPIALAHGSQDPVIDVLFGRAARATLLALGADVTWRESAMGHTIDPSFAHSLAGWLEGVVPPAS